MVGNIRDALVALYRTEHDTPIRVFLGPRERAWFAGSELARALADCADVEIIEGRSLVEVASDLAGCHRLVCNDSGLMHVAEAVGTPVLSTS